jgi:RNA polymerase sigma-70 factor (ECF subfamily)
VSEKERIEELKNNNRLVFNQFVDEFRPVVIRTCYSFLRNNDDALDVAQEVFLEVYNSIHHFRGDAKLSTWVFRIAVNCSLDALRKRNRKKRFADIVQIFGKEDYSVVCNLSDYSTPLHVVENTERQKALDAALNKLPETQRIAFTLSNMEDLSYQQIADITGTSLSSVESVIHRARENLRKHLKNYYTKNCN